MLDKVNPTVVSVATGGFEYCSDHYEPTMQALTHGCHVLCEKPICNELDKARAMVALAKNENPLCFGIDFNHRFTPAAYACGCAKKWVDQGELGSICFLLQPCGPLDRPPRRVRDEELSPSRR